MWYYLNDSKDILKKIDLNNIYKMTRSKDEMVIRLHYENDESLLLNFNKFDLTKLPELTDVIDSLDELSGSVIDIDEFLEWILTKREAYT